MMMLLGSCGLHFVSSIRVTLHAGGNLPFLPSMRHLSPARQAQALFIEETPIFGRAYGRRVLRRHCLKRAGHWAVLVFRLPR